MAKAPNYRAAAAALGVGGMTVLRRMKRLGITNKDVQRRRKKQQREDRRLAQ
jgi:hypothetical protein